MASERTDLTIQDVTQSGTDLFRRRVLTAVFITIAVVALLLLFYSTAEVLMLLFISLLLAIMLRAASHWLHAHTALPENLALAVVCIGVLLVIILFIFLLGPSLARQLDQLSQQLPQSLATLTDKIGQYQWGQQLLNQLPDNPNWTNILGIQSGTWFTRITGVVSATIGLFANVVLVLFTALFFAIEPRTYVNGIAQLVPPGRRERAKEVMYTVGDTLWKWLLTRFISMVFIGILTTIGLMLLNEPLSLTLGVIAGLMAFIPMIGPIIAVVPAVLIGFLQSPQNALWVLLLYLLVQSIDNYIVTPIVVKHTMRMPPALIIAAQLIAGVLFGQLGLMLAAPLAAASMTLVNLVYVQDFLNGGSRSEKTQSS